MAIFSNNHGCHIEDFMLNDMENDNKACLICLFDHLENKQVPMIKKIYIWDQIKIILSKQNLLNALIKISKTFSDIFPFIYNLLLEYLDISNESLLNILNEVLKMLTPNKAPSHILIDIIKKLISKVTKAVENNRKLYLKILKDTIGNSDFAADHIVTNEVIFMDKLTSYLAECESEEKVLVMDIFYQIYSQSNLLSTVSSVLTISLLTKLVHFLSENDCQSDMKMTIGLISLILKIENREISNFIGANRDFSNKICIGIKGLMFKKDTNYMVDILELIRTFCYSSTSNENNQRVEILLENDFAELLFEIIITNDNDVIKFTLDLLDTLSDHTDFFTKCHSIYGYEHLCCLCELSINCTSPNEVPAYRNLELLNKFMLKQPEEMPLITTYATYNNTLKNLLDAGCKTSFQNNVAVYHGLCVLFSDKYEYCTKKYLNAVMVGNVMEFINTSLGIHTHKLLQDLPTSKSDNMMEFEILWLCFKLLNRITPYILVQSSHHTSGESDENCEIESVKNRDKSKLITIDIFHNFCGYFLKVDIKSLFKDQMVQASLLYYEIYTFIKNISPKILTDSTNFDNPIPIPKPLIIRHFMKNAIDLCHILHKENAVEAKKYKNLAIDIISELILRSYFHPNNHVIEADEKGYISSIIKNLDVVFHPKYHNLNFNIFDFDKEDKNLNIMYGPINIISYSEVCLLVYYVCYLEGDRFLSIDDLLQLLSNIMNYFMNYLQDINPIIIKFALYLIANATNFNTVKLCLSDEQDVTLAKYNGIDSIVSLLLKHILFILSKLIAIQKIEIKNTITVVITHRPSFYKWLLFNLSVYEADFDLHLLSIINDILIPDIFCVWVIVPTAFTDITGNQNFSVDSDFLEYIVNHPIVFNNYVMQTIRQLKKGIEISKNVYAHLSITNNIFNEEKILIIILSSALKYIFKNVLIKIFNLTYHDYEIIKSIVHFYTIIPDLIKELKDKNTNLIDYLSWILIINENFVKLSIIPDTLDDGTKSWHDFIKIIPFRDLDKMKIASIAIDIITSSNTDQDTIALSMKILNSYFTHYSTETLLQKMSDKDIFEFESIHKAKFTKNRFWFHFEQLAKQIVFLLTKNVKLANKFQVWIESNHQMYDHLINIMIEVINFSTSANMGDSDRENIKVWPLKIPLKDLMTSIYYGNMLNKRCSILLLNLLLDQNNENKYVKLVTRSSNNKSEKWIIDTDELSCNHVVYGLLNLGILDTTMSPLAILALLKIITLSVKNKNKISSKIYQNPWCLHIKILINGLKSDGSSFERSENYVYCQNYKSILDYV